MPVISRRQLFAGGASLAVLAGGAGVLGWAGAPRTHHRPSTPTQPTAAALRLAAAYRREQDVVAQLGATITATPALAAQCQVLQRDHKAHVEALNFLLSQAGPTTAPPTSAPNTPTATSPAPPPATALASVPELVQLVKQAAAAAAADSAALSGSPAAVLASMAACGAAHAAWLS